MTQVPGLPQNRIHAFGVNEPEEGRGRQEGFASGDEKIRMAH
jgi:hypothetical protein